MTAPVGSMAKAQELLRTMLADCPSFQAWCGAPDAATAAARIYHEGPPMPRVGEAYSEDELATLRPFAILFTEPEEGFVATSIASSEAFDFAGSGRMIAVLEQDIPREIDRDKGEIDRRVKNAIGLIIDELCDRSGKAGFLAFHRVSFTGPARVDRDEKQSLGGGDAIGCELRFEWGVETGT